MLWIPAKSAKCTSDILKIQILSILGTVCIMIPSLYAGQNWPSFRGPSASGVTEGYQTAVKWDVGRSENVLWKTQIPGLSHSCPAVWGDRIFVTTAVKDQGQSSLKVGMYGDVQSVTEKNVFSWYIYCIDRISGKILWDRQSYRGKTKGKTAPKVQPCQFYCLHGWKLRRCILRIRRHVLLRYGGKAGMEKGPWNS